MNPATEYRKRTVESASPVGLIVLLYGGAVTALMRAIAAIDANDVERRVEELNRLLKIVTELQITLNFEQGGEVARSLDKFYSVMRAQILEASIKNSKPMLQDLVASFSSMKEAWQQVEHGTGANSTSGVQPVTAIPVQAPMAPFAATIQR